MEPGFLLSYWRPWDENSSFIDSWGDYLRDTSLIDYGAEKIGKHIKDASREQIYAIENASRQQSEATLKAAEMQAMVAAKIGSVQTEAIQKAAKMIGYQLEDTKKELSFLNRRMDIIREQQRLSLMLQDNIAQLLKIPDSEKERQQAITLGIQFFVNATKDPDLFDDALEEFLKAESLKKQDYFVLHRIGCIYMFTEKHLDIPLALDYFLRAGKYAFVESDPDALRVANYLTNPVNSDYTNTTCDSKGIQFIAADSYEKAALASYILGNDREAISYQKKAISTNDTPNYYFNLGKYLTRAGELEEAVKQIDIAVTKSPMLIDAILSDVDLAGEPMMINYIERKVKEVNLAVGETLDVILNDNDLFDEQIAAQLYSCKDNSYAEKMALIKNALSSPSLIIKQSLLSFIDRTSEKRADSPVLLFKSGDKLLFQLAPAKEAIPWFSSPWNDDIQANIISIYMEKHSVTVDNVNPSIFVFVDEPNHSSFIKFNENNSRSFVSTRIVSSEEMFVCILDDSIDASVKTISVLLKEYFGLGAEGIRNLDISYKLIDNN